MFAIYENEFIRLDIFIRITIVLVKSLFVWNVKIIKEKHLKKLELFFYKKQMSPLLGIKKIKTSLNKITNRNNAHFSSKQSSSFPVKIFC